jgi:putative aldouronate transport system permease protein
LRKYAVDSIFVTVLSYAVVGFFAVFTLFPFILLLAGSVSLEEDIIRYGYSLFPRHFSLAAYEYIFLFPQIILDAYKVSIVVTVVGTALSLFLSAMAAYVLYRKLVKYRHALAFFIFFTTLFHGGLASFYIVVTRYLHMKDTWLALIILPMFNVIYILILRSFVQSSIPDALVEAATIDGAGEFRIFLTIVLPLLKPALASIGLFTALHYWNDWFTAMLFIDDRRLFPLQFVLYQMLSNVNLAPNIAAHVTIDMPKETFKLALTVVAIGPIVLLYPFVQRYLIKGITIGAVKG